MTDSEILARWQGKSLAPEYGCHCEIEFGNGLPDGCVIDEGEPFNCVHTRVIEKRNDCQYWKPIAGTGVAPDYPNDAVACDSLLDTLVEKGYSYTLEESKDGVVFVVSKVKWSDTARLDFALTRREAIIAAVLEVAKRELGADEAARLEVVGHVCMQHNGASVPGLSAALLEYPHNVRVMIMKDANDGQL